MFKAKDTAGSSSAASIVNAAHHSGNIRGFAASGPPVVQRGRRNPAPRSQLAVGVLRCPDCVVGGNKTYEPIRHTKKLRLGAAAGIGREGEVDGANQEAVLSRYRAPRMSALNMHAQPSGRTQRVCRRHQLRSLPRWSRCSRERCAVTPFDDRSNASCVHPVEAQRAKPGERNPL